MIGQADLEPAQLHRVQAGSPGMLEKDLKGGLVEDRVGQVL